MGRQIILDILLSLCVICDAKPLSLIDTGILEEEDPIKRYWTLQQAHKLAEINHTEIDYSGIDSLSIEIPRDAVSIPLKQSCDFKDLKLYIVNKYKNFELFTLKNTPQPITLTPKEIDAGDFVNIPLLSKGFKLLYVRDTIPWVKERLGYGYPAYRKDIILIKNGLALNQCIQPYDDTVSVPECSYVEVQEKPTEISNIEIFRSEDSVYKTFCFCVDYQNNIVFHNIAVHTPESDMYGDRAITIKNSTNILFENVIIDGTYSRKDKSGYGIALDNVWNSTFRNLKGDAKWGIFGNNNINNSKIEDCDINRFDIHSYGCNVFCTNTTFRTLYNQFSSMYGTLEFTDCRFVNFTPVLIESSYQAYTEFDIVIKHCEYYTDASTSAIVKTGRSLNGNMRPNLTKLYWPNLNIDGLKISGTNAEHILYLYSSGRRPPILLDGCLKVDISGLKIDSPFEIRLCDKMIKSEEAPIIRISHSDINKL